MEKFSPFDYQTIFDLSSFNFHLVILFIIFVIYLLYKFITFTEVIMVGIFHLKKRFMIHESFYENNLM